ncbi:hypothetical protein NDU88_001423 [Pleurodeles waltl]|uniref:Uncharacterized protein n=1 Tax=Pleurodeles waltl TaxID=8319 RepID=A0AAV7MKG5_PLEWA|nr:hypothetical protein NDU88_001423 [Pleurodeles waltl]
MESPLGLASPNVFVINHPVIILPAGRKRCKEAESSGTGNEESYKPKEPTRPSYKNGWKLTAGPSIKERQENQTATAWAQLDYSAGKKTLPSYVKANLVVCVGGIFQSI